MTKQTTETRKHTIGRSINAVDYRIAYEVRLSYDEWTERHGDNKQPGEHFKELSEVEVIEMTVTPSTTESLVLDKCEALVLEHEWEQV